MTDAHLQFTIRYSSKAVEYYPGLQGHYDALLVRLVESRQLSIDWVVSQFKS